MPNATVASKADLVKSVFENVSKYLAVRQFDVRIRAETVKLLAEGLTHRRILDIGCGDGSISIPLLGPLSELTLLDLSESMLSRAHSRVPEPFRAGVQVRNQDFMKAAFPAESFDLILCLGVMAHVDSPEDFVAKITALLRPGGSLVLEFTDAFHFVGRIGRLLSAVKSIIRPPRYPVNLLSADYVFRLVDRHGLRVLSRFRYALPPLPGISILSHEARYRMIRHVNGSCENRRNQWWGNQYICLLTLDGPDR